ncbi:MAG: hypothetical protein LBF27_16335 [Sphingobacterium sp.]|jgi:hypothetical protein|nr:hypothetical protein [Sphingobacterium sp.]
MDNENELLFKSYGGKIVSKFDGLCVDEKLILTSQDTGLEQVWLRIGKYLADFFVSHELLRTA